MIKSFLTIPFQISLTHSFEQQEETLRQQSFNIEQTTNAVVAAKDATQIVKLMKQGVKELKKEQKKVTVESVEVIMREYSQLFYGLSYLNYTIFLPQDLHDELSQLFENADDIQNVFAENLHMPPIDDQELADQLELLGDELATDNDTSYLDEATGGSTPPAGPSVTLDMPNNTQPSSGSVHIIITILCLINVFISLITCIQNSLHSRVYKLCHLYPSISSIIHRTTTSAHLLPQRMIINYKKIDKNIVCEFSPSSCQTFFPF